MSVRLLTIRLAKHGRNFLRSYWNRDIHTNIFEHTNQTQTRNKRLPVSSANIVKAQSPVVTRNAAKNVLSNSVPRSTTASGIFRFGQHARKLFIDNILNRVTTTYSEELRNQATKKLFYGDSAPFFALVGVSLASGAGVLSKEDELEGVCWEIREAANRIQSLWSKEEVSGTLNNDFNIDNLDVGPALAKGCAAVVYAAAFKSSASNQSNNTIDASLATSINNSSDNDFIEIQLPRTTNVESMRPEYMTPIQNMSRFVHNFGGSVDNLNIYNQSAAVVDFVEELTTLRDVNNEQIAQQQQQTKQLQNIGTEQIAGQTVYSSGMQSMHILESGKVASINRYPLALKMMFNYDIQSNALAILRAMYKETVPARQRNMNASADEWEKLLQQQTMTLPPHPNIVCMFGFFCDEVRNFPDGHLLYPIAQPQRINPMGYGRNMSLYLLMKRYDYSLRALLDTYELSTRTKLLLLAQLLEAVTHISRHGIAHRDLKSDNVLVELNDDDTSPVLVLSDFGCCLADKVHGLQVPYTSYDIDKGGNAALMAPEIINKQPGPFAVLNYNKSDLWACGAIAYEIFGLRNPFYSSSGGLAHTNGELTFSLRNSDYKEDDLPPLSDACPMLIQQLIYNILNPNPSKRVSPDIAANILQLYLWAPSNWLKTGGMPNSPEILQWLLSLTTKVMCDGRPAVNVPSLNAYDQLNFNQSGRRTYVEYLLICSFLTRARLCRIRGALNWIQNIL